MTCIVSEGRVKGGRVGAGTKPAPAHGRLPIDRL